MTIYSKIYEYNINEAKKDNDKASGGTMQLQNQFLESLLNLFPKSKLYLKNILNPLCSTWETYLGIQFLLILHQKNTHSLYSVVWQVLAIAEILAYNSDAAAVPGLTFNSVRQAWSNFCTKLPFIKYFLKAALFLPWNQ